MLGVWTWIVPVVVLIVALHFFPMRIFRRTIDYYLGTAMLAVPVVGLYLAGQPRRAVADNLGGLSGLVLRSSPAPTDCRSG